MEEPEKPFACTIPDCRMTFTNEDHLHVHIKKHDMMLQLGEQKAGFVADQTPTPTRFIRNCEEVGLFQDLQNVNPFDEGFKRAMETKQGILSLDGGIATPSTEDLHTPQMFPLIDPTNITISRSSSDESGAIKEFETTTISKCTNQVTTISRVIEKHDEQKIDEKNHIKNNAVSYTNNVIKIQSNVVRKEEKTDAKIKECNAIPIMSQKSIENVVDSLTADFDKINDYEVLIKLPSGQQIRLVEDKERKTSKEMLKKVLQEKKKEKPTPTLVPNLVLSTGTLIPVSVINTVPIKCPNLDKKPIKRINTDITSRYGKLPPSSIESRCAASKRYRDRLKDKMTRQAAENKELKQLNDRLVNENNALKSIILEHIKKCNDCNDLKILNEKTKLS